MGENARLINAVDGDGLGGSAREENAGSPCEWKIGVGGSRSAMDSFSVNAATSLESGGDAPALEWRISMKIDNQPSRLAIL